MMSCLSVRIHVSMPFPSLCFSFHTNQGITKRCRLSLRTNSVSVYEPYCGGRGELRGLSQFVQLYTGAQINFVDLTPHLTYDINFSCFSSSSVYGQFTCSLMRINLCNLEDFLRKRTMCGKSHGMGDLHYNFTPNFRAHGRVRPD
jgi:hypothetical protein